MEALELARWQFGITIVYHFFFAPLTMGLAVIVAIIESMYVKTGDEKYKRMASFWGKLLVINFALGVVTGLVQEFQFGMNWSEYSRFVGDVFGAPLAIEGLSSFFLESTFLGVWIFGWNRLSKKVHAASMWLVAIGANLSGLWILIANSFMQQPVGYVIRNGRAEMIDFWSLITNPHVWVQFPHTLFAALSTGAFFVIGISAYHIYKKSKDQLSYQRSLKIGSLVGIISVIGLITLGHIQGQHMVEVQPMKMAAAEALWEDEDPASLSLFSVIDEKNEHNTFSVEIPGLLSFLSFNKFDGEVRGIKSLQAEFENKFGPGDYSPPVKLSYWSFRIMVGIGFIMLFVTGYLAIQSLRNKLNLKPIVLKLLVLTIALPYIANTTGWLLTEMGRQPWIVYSLMKTKDAVSNAVSAGNVLFTLFGFIFVYTTLIVVDFYLLRKFAIAGTKSKDEE